MDSEKYNEMQKLLREGRQVTDEGAYYHHSWWESYKGSVKGKVGGAAVGAAIGTVTGAVAVVGLTIATAGTFAILSTAGALVVAGFSAAGMVYGAHEFSEVGKVTGAVAAAQKTAEKRMKAFEASEFSEIKEDIAELKAIVQGTTPCPKTAAEETAKVLEEQENYRTSHFDEKKSKKNNGLVYPKIALVGAIIGVIVGIVLAIGGEGSIAADILKHALAEKTFQAMGAETITATSMITFGSLGASFGINRDIFRKIFDQTDLLFRGFVSHEHSRVELGVSQEKSIEKQQEKMNSPITTVVYDPQISYPESETYHRDKVMNAAKNALLSMDHTKMSPQ